MAEQKLQEAQIELTVEERENFKKIAETFNMEEIKKMLEILSMEIRAFEGKPIEPDDVITRLINIKNKMERSRFPTYPLLAKQVYLRLIAKYNKNATACKDWADMEAEALIAYKGLNWDAYVEMAKATSMPAEQQQFYLGPTQQAPKVEKRHFWQRDKSKKEESEFVHQ